MAKKWTTNEFIEQVQHLHKGVYSYINTKYIGAHNKVIITCPVHGDFEQTPHNHKMGKGCRKCANDALAKERKDADSIVITNFNKIHCHIYDYSDMKYKNAQTKITIICSTHGKFTQTPTSHLSGSGCPSCGIEIRKLTEDSVIARFKEFHNNKYDYSKVKYINTRVPVIIVCPIHGEFNQIVDAHLRGHGCPSCSKSGFDVKKSAIVYYLKVTTDSGTVLYKIGITNKSVNERFNLTDLNKIEIVKQEEFAIGQDALDKETEIKQKYKEFRYTGHSILQNGNTELFTENILNL